MTSKGKSEASLILTATIRGHSSDVNWCDFSSSQLLTCSGDKTTRIWSFVNENEWQEDKTISPLLGHSYYVNCCRFSPFETQILTCSTDGKCILWNSSTGQQVKTFEHPNTRVTLKAFDVTSDFSFLYTAGTDGTIGCWDLNENRLLRVVNAHEEAINCISLSGDDRVMAIGSSKGDVKLWLLSGGGCCGGGGGEMSASCHLVLLDAHDLGTNCCSFESNQYGAGGQYRLATGGNDDVVVIWHVETINNGDALRATSKYALKGHRASIMAVAFRPDGRLLASCSGDRTICLWDTKSGHLLHQMEAHARYVTSCVFSKDGRLLATGSNDRTVKIWRVESDLDPWEESTQHTSDWISGCSFRPVEQWTVENVCYWLRSVGLTEFIAAFRLHAIDGEELMNLNENTLQKDLKIEALGHRNKILRAIAEVKASQSLQHSNDFHDDSVPHEFVCPISQEIMRDPVIAADGFSYERAAIDAWLQRNQTSPMTNAPLSHRNITPNRSLKMLIQRFREEQQH